MEKFMIKKQTIYTVGPISGLSYEEVVSRYQKLTKELEELDFNVLCPMSGKKFLRNEIEFKAHGYDDHPMSTNHAIMTRDRWMLDQSDIILADLSNSGDRVSIGSMMELAWAYDTKKWVIGVIPKDNIHNHAFVLEACGTIVPTIEDALDMLRAFKAGARGL